MNENTRELPHEALENRSRALFQDSVDGIDLATRSRLTQARHAALQVAAASSRRPWLFRMPFWTPAVGIGAAALLGIAMWVGSPLNHVSSDGQTSLEDLDMVASSESGSGDAIEMLQDDLDFYDFADKASNSGPAA